MRRFYVYVHLMPEQLKDGSPADPCDPRFLFYVGKGTFKKGSRQRLTETYGRSGFWLKTVKKYGGYYPVVMFETNNQTEAFYWERRFIHGLGRRDLGTGPLVNLTDGGEGTTNPSAETLRRRSVALSKCKRSLVARLNYSRGQKNVSPETKAYRTLRKRQTSGRRVVDTTTRRIWLSAGEAAQSLGMKVKSLDQMLRRKRPNHTPLRWLDEQDAPPKPRADRTATIRELRGRAVVDTESGKRWRSVPEAAEAVGVKPATLFYRLTKKCDLRGALRFEDELQKRPSIKL
jgi:hypothetical protein